MEAPVVPKRLCLAHKFNVHLSVSEANVTTKANFFAPLPRWNQAIGLGIILYSSFLIIPDITQVLLDGLPKVA